MIELPPRPPWMHRAACRGVDPELFFPGRGDKNDQAAAICQPCPVRLDCLDHAITTGEKLGMWGGLNEKQRRRARRERRAAELDNEERSA